jgi:hypothetical protein
VLCTNRNDVTRNHGLVYDANPVAVLVAPTGACASIGHPSQGVDLTVQADPEHSCLCRLSWEGPGAGEPDAERRGSFGRPRQTFGQLVELALRDLAVESECQVPLLGWHPAQPLVTRLAQRSEK